MLALEERFMIRELYRKGVSISEIARRSGRDRKTIRQTVNAPDLLPPKHSRQVKACKIDPYVSYLEQRMAEGVLQAGCQHPWPCYGKPAVIFHDRGKIFTSERARQVLVDRLGIISEQAPAYCPSANDVVAYCTPSA